MRARPNAPSNHPAASVNDGAVVVENNPDDSDANGKDKPQSKFKRPPVTSFKLPPPPKVFTSPAFRSHESSSSKVSVGPSASDAKSKNDHDRQAMAALPAIPIPPPPSTTSVYQRPLRRNNSNQQSDSVPTAFDSNQSAPLAGYNNNHIIAAAKSKNSMSRDSYSNAYSTQQYPTTTSNSSSQKIMLAHPYQPSSWYVNKRNAQRNNERAMKIFLAITAMIVIILVLWTIQQFESMEHGQRRHHTANNKHHHDHHSSRHDVHLMMGIGESPLGFSSRKERGYRQLEQQESGGLDQHQHQQHDSDLFSIFPVTTLSNGRVLPYVGFGVASRHVEHKQIPTIVSTLLQYSSTETIGGGGISMIDAIIHDENKLADTVVVNFVLDKPIGLLLEIADIATGIGAIISGFEEGSANRHPSKDSLMKSRIITIMDINVADHSFDDVLNAIRSAPSPTRFSVAISNERQNALSTEEANMSKTVIQLVGRSITFFGKEHIKSTHGFLSGMTLSSDSNDINSATYDYENRLEIHVLVGLSGAQLGIVNTITALRDFVVEMEGIIPPFPSFSADLSEWTVSTSPMSVDHRLDVRLHVLLRLNQCHDHLYNVVPCSLDEESNRQLLELFLGSYTLLKRLYDGNIIHGFGLDGVEANDIQYLLNKSQIKPLLYRGNVEQALDIYSRRHGHDHIQEEKHIASILKKNNVTFLVANAAGTILDGKEAAPNAYALLQNLGSVLYKAHQVSSTQGSTAVTSGHKGEGLYYTVPKLVLAYLVHHKVCVLPHAYKAEHLADDAPESIAGLAKFLSARRVAEIGAAIRALLSGVDLSEDHGLGMEGESDVAGVFHMVMEDWVYISKSTRWEEPGEMHVPGELSWTLHHGDYVVIIAKAGDIFRAYSPTGIHRGIYTMGEIEGGVTDFIIAPPLDYTVEEGADTLDSVYH